MKLKSKILASAVVAASFLASTAAMAAPSISLNLVYLGSTTGNANSAAKIAQNTGNGAFLTTATAPGGDLTTITNGLTKTTDLKDNSIQGTTNLKNYFAVYVNFVPDAGQKLWGVGFDVNYPAGMAPVSGNNNSDTSTAKALLWNPLDTNISNAATWENAGDNGIAGDLIGFGFFQLTADNAFAMAIGTPDGIPLNGDDAGYISGKGTLLGVFALKFTSTNVTGSVSLTPTLGNNGWYNTQVNTDVSTLAVSAVGTSGGIQIGTSAPDTPEPASLGVLALGGLALLARRRK
jgi:hypothetical protein